MSNLFHKKLILLFFVAALVAIPAVSLAGPNYVNSLPPGPNSIISIPVVINAIIDTIWKIFFGVAVIMFIIAGIEFLTAHGDSTKVSKAKAFVIWGIVGIVVAVSAFSIVKIVTKSLECDPTDNLACDPNAP